ncbi:gp16 family protein [Desulforegula conservatrix]|uniref:gp16 family protein n=1 Tax=Desulforegula conservatrix TaxID=153026 RepID=UPI0003F89246|nr:regulatory protein GemA [Desulforegula conservatrix]
MKTNNDAIRRAKLAKIHIAKKALGMDDDTYREMLAEFGLKSSKDANIAKLNEIITHLESKGFEFKKPKNQPRSVKSQNDRQKPETALMGKIGALLADGKLNWNYAHGIAKKMFGVERLEWCDCQQLRKIVAALEYNTKRKAKKA